MKKVNKDTEVGLDLLLKFEVGNKNSINNGGKFFWFMAVRYCFKVNIKYLASIFPSLYWTADAYTYANNICPLALCFLLHLFTFLKPSQTPRLGVTFTGLSPCQTGCCSWRIHVDVRCLFIPQRLNLSPSFLPPLTLPRLSVLCWLQVLYLCEWDSAFLLQLTDGTKRHIFRRAATL